LTLKSLKALMGCSGAGKTSLLKAINGINAKHITRDSKILVNKYRIIKQCFISQDVSNHIIAGITAGEAMTYALKLKNTNQDLNVSETVEEIMKELQSVCVIQRRKLCLQR
jgi:ABC-type multidrug transport system ATPase subunit